MVDQLHEIPAKLSVLFTVFLKSHFCNNCGTGAICFTLFLSHRVTLCCLKSSASVFSCLLPPFVVIIRLLWLTTSFFLSFSFDSLQLPSFRCFCFQLLAFAFGCLHLAASVFNCLLSPLVAFIRLFSLSMACFRPLLPSFACSPLLPSFACYRLIVFIPFSDSRLFVISQTHSSAKIFLCSSRSQLFYAKPTENQSVPFSVRLSEMSSVLPCIHLFLRPFVRSFEIFAFICVYC